MDKIAILTSGGDASGMNAIIAYLTKYAIAKQLEVFYVKNGYYGLYHNHFITSKELDLTDFFFMGGTVIGSSRFKQFQDPSLRKQAVLNLKKRGINNLVVIGGDGSYMGAKALSELGLNCFCLPGTIDNDVNSSEFTIGFWTALEAIRVNVEAIYHTTKSHNRLAIIEVMGRDCSDLTIFGGLATNASFVVTSKNSLDLNGFEKAVRKVLQFQNYCVVLVSENIYGKNGLPSLEMVKEHFENNAIKCNLVSLGHTQRGFSPNSIELFQISLMAKHTIDLVVNNANSQVIGMKNNQAVNYDFNTAFNLPKADRTKLLNQVNTAII